MITACGAWAAAYARGLGELDAVVTEPEELERAVREAVRRRERGERFYAMVLFDNPGPKLTRLNAASVLAGIADYDLQLVALDQLASGVATTPDEQPVREFWRLEPYVVRLMEDFYGLADAMLVRSYAECARLAEISPLCLREVERVLVEPVLPAIERTLPTHPSVVVWAPRRPALEVALHAFALREFIGEVTCVTAGGEVRDQLHAAYVTAADPHLAGILAGAACVVCVEPDDPGDAVAFAHRGFGVVAPLTSGAHEFVGGAVAWNGLPSALHACVAIALGRPAVLRPPPPPLAPIPYRPSPAWAAGEAPLVSIVVPTYNRPRDLWSLLTSLAAQTYPNLEVVVVNDGGAALDELVSEFPFVRLIDHPTNLGAYAAVETGRREVRGRFFDVIADDDVLYPDHLERLVDALLRSGARVGHGAGVWRQVERRDDGSFATLRVNLSHLRGTTTPSDALVWAPIAIHQLLQDPRTWAEVRGMRSELASVGDQEQILRLAQRFTFVYVDHVTSEFRDEAGTLGKQYDARALWQAVYEQFHPRADRPEIDQRRRRTFQGLPEQFVEWRDP